MDIKHLHSTRFLPISLIAVLIFALTGCASTPDDDYEEEEVEVAEAEAVESNEVPAVLLSPAAPVSRTAELKPNYPEKYTVVKGDTLWDISARFLKDPWMWPKLWHFNPQIANPHLIYPGDILTIIFIDGKPVIQVTRNGKVVNALEKLPSEVIESGQHYPTVKLSPRIREEGLESAIPTISIDAIGPFLNRPRVVNKGELDAAPYIVEHGNEHIMSGGGYKVYVRGLKEQGLQGNYIVVRSGKVYRNPKNEDDILGYEAVHLGEARLTRFGDPSTLHITDSDREIIRGDRLIPKGDEIIQHSFSPRAPEHQIDGQIIATVDGALMIGEYQVVVLNLGRQDDVIPGHVLAVNQSGREIQDTVSNNGTLTLPTERAGTVMIFRVFDRVSYALVMEATKTIHLLDQVTNP